jgi:hypothetical protein
MSRTRQPSGTSPTQCRLPPASTRSGSRITCSPSAWGIPSGCVIANFANPSRLTRSPRPSAVRWYTENAPSYSSSATSDPEARVTIVAGPYARKPWRIPVAIRAGESIAITTTLSE